MEENEQAHSRRRRDTLLDLFYHTILPWEEWHYVTRTNLALVNNSACSLGILHSGRLVGQYEILDFKDTTCRQIKFANHQLI